jgi:hypothetical protein
MTPYYQEDGITIHGGECADVLPSLPPGSVHAIVTDPPYGLAFMGKGWDYDVPGVEVWRECLRVLKPGGHLLAFSGTRTYHRAVVAIEDAGFEIRDMVGWIYGSGFPKSLDVGKAIDKEAGAERQVLGWSRDGCGNTESSIDKNFGFARSRESAFYLTAPATGAAKQWDGWGTGLKPAHEPICLARKPLDGTVAANVLAHGTGALNIDGCRVGATVETWPTSRSYDKETHSRPGANYGVRQKTGPTPPGRWPANLILSYPEDEYELRDDVKPEQLRALAEWMESNANA